MDWDQYYEKFYDWATSTQISRMSSLTSYGASSEVAEVAQEYMDEKAASRLIKSNRSIIPRYRKVVVPGTHTAENHDFISPDQGSRSSISKSLRCATRSGNTLSR